MPTVWWSNQLPDGAQVQLFCRAVGAWVGPPAGRGGWTGGSPSVVSASLASPPSPLQVFTVVRTGAGLLLLLAPNRLFLAVQPDGTLAATATDTGYATAFNVTQVRGTWL